MTTSTLIQAKQIDVPSLEAVVNHDNLVGFNALEHERWDLPTGSPVLVLDDSRVVASNVTQHVGSIDHNLLLNYVPLEHERWDQAAVGSPPTVLDDSRIAASSVTQHVGTIDHDSLLNYVADEHVAHISVMLTAGNGLTGGGDITTSRTFDVGAGAGITVGVNDVRLDTASTRNTDHTAVTLTAGVGLSGGGDISASRTFDLNANIDDLNDVDTGGSPTITSGDILTWNGTNWRNGPNTAINKVTSPTTNAVATLTAGGEVQDSVTAAPAALPRLPVVSTSDITLGVGAAGLPTGTVAFVQGDGSPAAGSPAAFFVFAYVDDTGTWIRSDTQTVI